MSERGSFTTEYIYCDECLKKAKAILLSSTKMLCSQEIKSWSPDDTLPLPIIAGKVGGYYMGEELITFMLIAEELEKQLCHPMRIAVLAEEGSEIFNINPKRTNEQEVKDD